MTSTRRMVSQLLVMLWKGESCCPAAHSKSSHVLMNQTSCMYLASTVFLRYFGRLLPCCVFRVQHLCERMLLCRVYRTELRFVFLSLLLWGMTVPCMTVLLSACCFGNLGVVGLQSIVERLIGSNESKTLMRSAGM